MALLFSGDCANEIWQRVSQELLNKSSVITSRKGNTRELLHVLLSLSDPHRKWISDRKPPISIGYALADLIWVLNGSNDAKVINFWNPALPNYAGHGKKYHGAYGYRIRKNFAIDQLERAYFALTNNSDNRQTVILIWDPEKDMPLINGKPADEDIPCNICSFLKIRDNKLEWTQIMRSNDAFMGLPYNLVQFTSLQEILAGWLGKEVGTYTHYSDSLHVYETSFKCLKNKQDIKVENNDSLSVDKKQFDVINKEIFSRMTSIVKRKNIPEDFLLNVANLNSANQAYNNIMSIIVAYVALKKGYSKIEKEIISNCTNDLYKAMWDKWKMYRMTVKRGACL